MYKPRPPANGYSMDSHAVRQREFFRGILRTDPTTWPEGWKPGDPVEHLPITYERKQPRLSRSRVAVLEARKKPLGKLMPLVEAVLARKAAEAEAEARRQERVGRKPEVRRATRKSK